MRQQRLFFILSTYTALDSNRAFSYNKMKIFKMHYRIWSVFSFIVLILKPGLTIAQETASVDITFENATYHRIERPSFYQKFKANYTSSKNFDGPAFVQAYMSSKPGDESQQSDRFNLTKLSESHYMLHYRYKQPGIVYINMHPVLISPGDNTKVVYKREASNRGSKDTIIATGSNPRNYTFSNFFNSRLVKGDNFPDLRSAKYQTNGALLYDDLVKAYSFREAYYNSFLRKYNYEASLSAFIRRANHIEFLSHALSLETELAENYKGQLSPFSERMNNAFARTNFIQADTNYTYRMEELFNAYFWSLTHTRYKNINVRENFDSLLKYINGYPNSFVKEYFLFFLIAEYNDAWKKYRPENRITIVKGIKNPAIKEALQNYDY